MKEDFNPGGRPARNEVLPSLAPSELNRRRIFLAHVQKTAGTAINNAFLNFGMPVPRYWDSEFVEDIRNEKDPPPYAQIVIAEDHILERDGIIYRGWAADLSQSEFFYAFSHLSLDDVVLPNNAIVFTVLRNPVERVVSHYSELEGWYVDGLAYNYTVDGSYWKSWMADGFAGYLESIPQTELMNHLHVYGGLREPQLAMDRLGEMEFVLFNDQLDRGFPRFCERLGLRLELPRIRVQKRRYSPGAGDLELLCEKIAPEIEFYEEARRRFGLPPR